MAKICCIVGAAPLDSSTLIIPEKAFIIAADGGYAVLKAQGITPDLAVGDFDSLGFCPEDVPVIRHPVMKDDTDMTLAMKEGLARGCDTFVIYGGLGGRFDHSMANLQSLAWLAEQGGRGYLIDERQVICAIHNSRLTLGPHHTGYLSVFCHGAEAHGVSLTGLLYPLQDATLAPTFPLGVSNEFIGAEATVAVSDGTLLVMWEATGKTHDLM